MNYLQTGYDLEQMKIIADMQYESNRTLPELSKKSGNSIYRFTTNASLYPNLLTFFKTSWTSVLPLR